MTPQPTIQPQNTEPDNSGRHSTLDLSALDDRAGLMLQLTTQLQIQAETAGHIAVRDPATYRPSTDPPRHAPIYSPRLRSEKPRSPVSQHASNIRAGRTKPVVNIFHGNRYTHGKGIRQKRAAIRPRSFAQSPSSWCIWVYRVCRAQPPESVSGI